MNDTIQNGTATKTHTDFPPHQENQQERWTKGSISMFIQISILFFYEILNSEVTLSPS